MALTRTARKVHDQAAGMKTVFSLMSIAAFSYLGLLLLIFLFQDRLLYLPSVGSRTIVHTPARLNLDFEDVWLRTDDGVLLHGWWVPGTGDRTVLFFHGNAGNISHRLEFIDLFNGLGLSVLMLDYRGYGQSSGRPSEDGTYRDAAAAWQHLTEARNIPADQIILFGRSLGGSVAAHLAASLAPGQTPALLVVESAFSSANDIAAEVYPYLPVRWISRFSYDTRDYVSRSVAPVLVIHSLDDEIIPYHHGQTNFDAAAEPKQFLQIRGSHNRGVGRGHYVNGLRQHLLP
ncbi:MAG: alpha/beta hydrolase [Xanthomonadales bacterium]|nr:alpha/beta hydrolase [Xanthomonadales bacterium]